VLLSFLCVRLLGAVVNNVSDCDETFNYWEPSHYMLYGWGFQTWEYSPEFALRPYAYAGIHALLGKVFTLLGFADKISVFIMIRCALGAFCAYAEAVFYRGVSKKFGGRVGLFTFVFLLLSAGMFHASISNLPSSLSMYGVLLSFGFWLSGSYFLAVFSACFAVIMGWPFVAVVFVPLGLDLLLKAGFFKVLLWGLTGLAVFLSTSIAVDHHYYGSPLIAVWNLVHYNVFAPKGSELYGVEEWPFYFINLFLNFNVVFVLSLIALPAALLFRKWSKSLGHVHPVSLFFYLLPYYLWLAAMLKLPHKEERFMFVMYPLICLGGALTFVVALDVLRALLASLTSSKSRKNEGNRFKGFLAALALLFCLGFVVLSASRVAALRINFEAPLHVYDHLYHNELKDGADPNLPLPGDLNICVGKEWYRFPSNFWIPDPRFHVSFIRSSFRGELPRPYAPPPDGSKVIHKDFNDQNQEEMSRYINESDCHYIVDLDFEGQSEPHYAAQTDRWEVIFAHPFINSAASHPFFRAFYVPPPLSAGKTRWDRYVLLRSKTHFSR
jgi:alpha-1,2-mannosyltransferase